MPEFAGGRSKVSRNPLSGKGNRLGKLWYDI